MYFLIAIIATTLGSITGMGGGIIMKPILDYLNHYNIETIGILSSVTVLFMAIVSISRQLIKYRKFSPKAALFLSSSSILGGIFGERILNVLVLNLSHESVKLIQNFILSILLILIFLYVLNKKSLPSYKFRNALVFFIVGCLLGILASFLGIGGGPINVAILIFFFSFDTKEAAFYSLVTILFSQLSKITTVYLTKGFSGYDLKVLPFMVLGGILGGLIGSHLNNAFEENKIEIVFNCIVIFMFIVCMVNIVNVLVI